MKKIERYEAFDGKVFDNATECRKYESSHASSRLVGLTIEQIMAAIERKPSDAVPDALEIGEAIENIAYQISKKRVADGDLKRKPKGDQPPSPPPSAEG